jgi:beta-lactamase regulating signal transducer with metallopeptidase domain
MKISLIILGGLAASFLLRHRSAALRHWVLAAAIVCAAAVPLFEAIVPAWRLPIAAPAAFEPYVDDSQERVAVTAPPSRGVSQNSAGRPATPANRTAFEFDFSGSLVSIWIAGTLVSLSILVVGILRMRWLASRSRPVTRGRWSDLAEEVSQAYGLRRTILLLESDHPSLLVTWGFRKPKVILPAAAGAWSDERTRVVLTHELAHVRRGDWAVQIAAELLRAVYWFNPLLWIACRRLRLESEHACDDEVMNYGVDGSDYASHLIDLARALNHRRYTWFPAPAMARPSSLERRVRAMLNDRLNRAPITGTTRAAVVVALLALTMAVAAAQSAYFSFSGTVADESSRGVPGVTVILTNEQRQMKYEVKSNESGRFEFVGLPAGEYGLLARGIGFQEVKDVVSISGRNLQRDIALKLGTLQETITVTFNPAEGPGDVRAPQPAPRVKEVELKAPKECVASSAGGQIVPPKKIRDVAPIYPVPLRGTGTSGTVVMEARIGTDGYVNDLRLIGDAHPELAHAAIAAVRDWRYTQTLLNCQPVEVTMTVTTNFTRQPPPPPPPPAPRP